MRSGCYSLSRINSTGADCTRSCRADHRANASSFANLVKKGGEKASGQSRETLQREDTR
jgi:hypothetical protein